MNGINTYQELATTSPDRLSEILNEAGGLMARMQPATWPAQSQMATDGRWDELKVWQDELDGGIGAAAPVEADDLSKVEGIGPKVAEVLGAEGITTFAQLAATSPDRIKEILAASGGVLTTMDPGTWPAQAQMAADGKWDELKVWQDELDGGKPVESAEPDDLTKVEGIGPKVAELLGAAGIQTFGQLAATTPERISEILAEAGGMMATMNPGTWPAQAKMAAEGKWDELKVWQDELDGGI